MALEYYIQDSMTATDKWQDTFNGIATEIQNSFLNAIGPTNLLCEQETNPTNVSDNYPEFSAIFNGRS